MNGSSTAAQYAAIIASGIIPVAAWDPENHWQGRVRVDLLPQEYDPQHAYRLVVERSSGTTAEDIERALATLAEVEGKRAGDFSDSYSAGRARQPRA